MFLFLLRIKTFLSIPVIELLPSRPKVAPPIASILLYGDPKYLRGKVLIQKITYNIVNFSRLHPYWKDFYLGHFYFEPETFSKDPK